MTATLPILTFHSIDDQPSVISFPPDRFARGLSRLHEHGFRTIELTEAAALVRRQAPLPERTIVITFDDGYRNNFDNAFPVLERLGMCATVFLTVGAEGNRDRLPSLEGREMLSWSEIRRMHDSGLVRFGAHTLTHRDLTRLSAEEIEAEARGSKRVIEDATEAPVTTFAYPFGRFDTQSRGVVSRVFDCACSDRLGVLTTESDVFAMERVDAYYLRADWSFDLLRSRSFRWYVWSRNVPRTIRRAVTR